MTERELLSEVSKATGEPLSIVRQLGFSVVDDSSLPSVVDWDAIDEARMGYLPNRCQACAIMQSD